MTFVINSNKHLIEKTELLEFKTLYPKQTYNA